MKPGYKFLGVVFLAILAIGLVACQQEQQEQTADETAVPATAVSRSDTVNTLAVDTGVDVVSAEGEVVPLRSVELSFPVGGTVAEIVAKAGTAVTAGDPIISLDATLQKNMVAQAEAALSAAEANLTAARSRLELAQSAVEKAKVGVTAAEAQLALVKSGPTAEEIAAAESNLRAAQAAVAEAVGKRDDTLNVSDAKVQAAQAEVVAAQADVQSLQEAYDQILDSCFELPNGDEVCPLYGPVEENTRFQLEAARARLQAAQAKLNEARAGATPAEQQFANAGVALAVAQRDQAQAQLDLLKAGPREEQIQQAEVGVEQAQLAVEQAEVEVKQAEAAVTQAEAAVADAKANLISAQKALERMTIRAPFDGTVSDITVEVGEVVGPGMPVVKFADFSEWFVETTDLTELDVVEVKVGLPAEIRIDAIPGEVLQGTVTDIASVAQLSRGDVTYKVKIALDNDANLPIRWGMTAFVNIDTSS